MKKICVLTIAIVLVCSSGLPSVAADAPEWKFYGHARMATWYDNVSEEKAGGSVTGDTALGPDDSGTIWNLQSNSRIGARVQGETIGGRFEYSADPEIGLRMLYGTYTRGAH